MIVNLGHMAFGPLAQQAKGLGQRVAEVGESVVDRRRHAVLYASRDQSVRHESLQGLGQHLLGDTGHPTAKFCEPDFIVGAQDRHHHRDPFAADAIKEFAGGTRRTEQVTATWGGHLGLTCSAESAFFSSVTINHMVTSRFMVTTRDHVGLMSELVDIDIEDGVRLNVSVTGRGDAVLLVHGWPHTHRLWEPLVELLGGARRAIAPDLRGVGGSSRAAKGTTPAPWLATWRPSSTTWSQTRRSTWWPSMPVCRQPFSLPCSDPIASGRWS